MNSVKSAVTLSHRGSVLVAEIDSPPVNALSHAVRAGILAAIDALEGNAEITALVITASGKQFSAGADVKEFGSPMFPPHLGDIIARLDSTKKPVVAAMQGSAFGGGLEVALACNARIANTDVVLALPEVKLGILPGAGGALRLPRLIGIDAALDVIAEGKQLGARRALELCLLDRIAQHDLLAEAVELANELARSGTLRRASDLPFPEFGTEKQADACKALARKFKGREAPMRAVELFSMAARTPFAEAVRIESETCKALLASSQSRALRHIFAAERMAAKPSTIPADASSREIDVAGVVGEGTMGKGITIAMLDAGLSVTLVGRTEASTQIARDAIAKTFDSLIKRGSLTEEKKADRLARLRTSGSIVDLANTDLVVETITEDTDSKLKVIAQIDAIVSDSAIVATNTSFLDIERLATASSRPRNFAGLHFFNPANVMKLVEIVRTSQSTPEVLATLMALARRLRKTPVLVGPSEGFVANRMLAKRTREGLFLLQEGATPAQVDRVLSGFGLPIGPFALADMAGLDVLAATRKARSAGMSTREREVDIIETLVSAGRLGRKSGAGYYSYDADGKPADDPAVSELLASHRAARNIEPRTITDEEVLDRCLLAIVNEGAKLLDEKVVERAGDIDVIWTAGLGFPAHLGGPMFWATETGLGAVRQKLDQYAAEVGEEFFRPSPTITSLAVQGAGFR
ncbi:MAG: 3-hydroxybutyryl-CoA epimerase [Rhizobium sp.]|nr:3-hydroxybutyryl-CoA epimerase [Rhizobium sp.]